MSDWIDLVGSYIIGGLVLLMIVGLNIFVSNSSTDNLYTNIAQASISTTSNIIHNDFYKIGYRIANKRIVLADSSRIKFYSDINNEGNIDSIYYYTGPVSQLTSTPNPNDKLLYRILNNSSELSSNAIVKFKLTYFDSLGAKIPYNLLTSQSILNSIRTIQVYVLVESSAPVDGVYQAAEWQERIIPRNLSSGITNFSDNDTTATNFVSDGDDGDSNN